VRLLVVAGASGALVPALAISRRSSSLTSTVNLRSPRRARSRWALIRSAAVAMAVSFRGEHGGMKIVPKA
jgi:hypothetical protein